MEDLKKQESTVDSTELTGEQLDAVCGGQNDPVGAELCKQTNTMLDIIAPIFSAAGVNVYDGTVTEIVIPK